MEYGYWNYDLFLWKIATSDSNVGQDILKSFYVMQTLRILLSLRKKGYLQFFLVPNVLTVMQDIQKVKHIYFSYSWNLFMFEGSKRIWGWWIACSKPKSVWILNYCRWNTLFHFMNIRKMYNLFFYIFHIWIREAVNNMRSHHSLSLTFCFRTDYVTIQHLLSSSISFKWTH